MMESGEDEEGIEFVPYVEDDEPDEYEQEYMELFPDLDVFKELNFNDE